MTQGFALTTPLFYVNALPHIGSAYPAIAADALARYYRLRGRPVRFITGTDEHGLKIERTAAERKLSPQVHSDEIAQGFEQLWKALSINYDRFIRTSDPRHTAIVSEFFQRVWQAGDIYKGRYTGLYCVDCEEFKRPQELVNGNECPIHRKPVREQDEENYIFALSRYQEKLEWHYASNPQFIQPDFRRNEVLNFVREGLEDFSISRAVVRWGIPLPTDPTQTLYVWVDALLGYITALLEPEDEPTLENALRRWWPVNLHIVGKDILRFHCVYWPAMLLSAGLPLPERIFGHGFLTRDGEKMGKSRGNVIDPIALTSQYGADAVRYYLLKEIEFGRDSDFSELRFKQILNADLANDLGNLLNRTLNLAQKYCSNAVPDLVVGPANPLRELAETLTEHFEPAFESLAFSTACDKVMAMIRAGNKYLDVQAPWSLIKQGPSEQQAAREVFYAVLESVRIAAVLLSPVIPSLTSEIYRQLGFSPQQWESLDWRAAQWGGLPPGQVLAERKVIFPRLD